MTGNEILSVIKCLLGMARVHVVSCNTFLCCLAEVDFCFFSLQITDDAN
jgi:hypothetical protein